MGDVNTKTTLAYEATRGAVQVVNTLQMAVAEAYINGLEIPDPVLQGLFDNFMPIFFKYFPSLLAPYDWVLKETENIAEDSGDLRIVEGGLFPVSLRYRVSDFPLTEQYCNVPDDNT